MKKKTGFASMAKEKQRAIASLGGKKVQALGIGYHWTSETARIAGKKGGEISKRTRKHESQ